MSFNSQVTNQLTNTLSTHHSTHKGVSMNTDRQTDRQTARQTDRQTKAGIIHVYRIGFLSAHSFFLHMPWRAVQVCLKIIQAFLIWEFQII